VFPSYLSAGINYSKNHIFLGLRIIRFCWFVFVVIGFPELILKKVSNKAIFRTKIAFPFWDKEKKKKKKNKKKKKKKKKKHYFFLLFFLLQIFTI